MGIILKHKRHYRTRLIPWLIVIIFLGLSPILIGLLGASISEWATGKTCHEGNCFWGALPWMAMITIPVGFLVLIAYLIIVIIDAVQLEKKK